MGCGGRLNTSSPLCCAPPPLPLHAPTQRPTSQQLKAHPDEGAIMRRSPPNSGAPPPCSAAWGGSGLAAPLAVVRSAAGLAPVSGMAGGGPNGVGAAGKGSRCAAGEQKREEKGRGWGQAQQAQTASSVREQEGHRSPSPRP